MKRTNQKNIRLIAFTLAVCLLLALAGCFSNEEISSNPNESIEGHPANTESSLLSTLPTGLITGESREISEEDSEKIENALMDMESLLRDDPDGVSVKQRNWASYSSSLGKALLNDAEATFYDRLDTFCLGYLKNTDRNAIESSLLDDQWCVASGVPYADLGLTYEEAGVSTGGFCIIAPSITFLAQAI